MTLIVICVVFGLAIAVMVAAVFWGGTPTPAGEGIPKARPPRPGPACDLCDTPAVIRVVSRFDDAVETEMGSLGGSVMVADYCDTHLPADAPTGAKFIPLRQVPTNPNVA